MKENPAKFTKKQEAEETQKGCEGILSRLTHNMLDMISEIDSNGIRTYVSPSHKTIVGYEADFLKGKSVFEFTHPDDLERLKYEFNKGIKEQKPVKVEYRRLHSDGHYIWVESMGNPVYDKDGNFTGGIITTRDITERKKYEKALEYRLAIEKLITSLATGFINISTCDIDEEINKSLKILGKFMGAARACMYIVSDTDNTEVYEWHIEGQEAGHTFNPSTESFTGLVSKLKSGEVVYIPNMSEVPEEAEYLKNSGIYSLISIPIITHNIFTGFIGFENFSSEKEWKEEDIRLLKLIAEIFVNILKRKESEEKLRKSEARLSQTQRIARLGSYKSELSTGKLVWSEETFRITGMDPLREEPSLNEYINMLHSEDRIIAKETIDKTIREKKPFDIEYRIILPDGSLKYVQSIGYPVVNDKGTVIKIVGTIMDITERKNGEEERKKIE
ncbi:MAG: PAS domain-containing protein, partial [Candidatus Eremiobacterota bacterium]